MALIQYSALVNSMSGKLNGSVAAFNKGGSYLRNKGIVANPNTPAQVAVRSFFSSIASAWRDLTEAQRSGWGAFAAATPYRNRFGETKYLSGFGMYQQRNLNVRLVAGAFLEDYPTDVPFFLGTFVSVVIAASTGNIGFTYSDVENLGTWAPVIDATGPISSGVTNFKNKIRMLPGSEQSGTLPARVFSNDQYASIYGLPITGNSVGLGLYFVNSVTGQSSLELMYATVVS